MNKLAGITEMVLTLNELDNVHNLENRRINNTLSTYYVTVYENSTHFEPYIS